MGHILQQSKRDPRNRNAHYQQQRQKNQRMALVLASIAATFFIGFMLKMVLLGR